MAPYPGLSDLCLLTVQIPWTKKLNSFWGRENFLPPLININRFLTELAREEVKAGEGVLTLSQRQKGFAYVLTPETMEFCVAPRGEFVSHLPVILRACFI